MIGEHTSRSTWFAARARTAARRGVRIALVGGLAVIATVSVLIFVPHEVDRQLQRQIAALPPAPDTVPLMQQLAAHHATLQSLLRDAGAAGDSVGATVIIRDTLPITDSTIPSPTARDLFGETAANTRFPSVEDTLASELADRILRARLSPLPGVFQRLAESPILAGNSRVEGLIDSIELVSQEREAHAALGGPGARYAALTTLLTTLGQRLVSVAEGQLTGRRESQRTSQRESQTGSPNGMQDGVLSADSARENRGERLRRDSVRQHQTDSLQRLVVQSELRLQGARDAHTSRDSIQNVLQRKTSGIRPPVAMLLAALVVGMAVGYLVVFGRELQHPTVSDAQEVERLTQAPVYIHAPAAPRSTNILRTRRRERYARIVGGPAPLIDRASETFALVHLALTGVGDVVADVEVRADEPVIEAAVALSVAAAAAKESRAALVVEATRRHAMLSAFLGVTRREELHELTLERDERIDVLFADANTDQFSNVARRYDLRLHVVNRGAADALTTLHDVVLCVRQGHSTVAWLTRATEHARRRNQRIRGVVLWSRPLPVV